MEEDQRVRTLIGNTQGRDNGDEAYSPSGRRFYDLSDAHRTGSQHLPAIFLRGW